MIFVLFPEQGKILFRRFLRTGSELDGLNADRTRVVNEKGDMAEDLSDQLVRVRSGIKGLYGNDSSEYEMVGGTRASERKKAKRKEGGE